MTAATHLAADPPTRKAAYRMFRCMGSRRLAIPTISLAFSCLAFATPAAAIYRVIASAGVSAGSGTCNDIQNTGELTAPSASASATSCPSGSAEATADLTTASISLFAFADSTPQTLTITSAEAEFFDVLHFQVPPEMQDQPFDLGVVFVLDGFISADATPTVTTLLSSRCVLIDLDSVQVFDGLLVDTSPVSGLRTVHGTLLITPPDYTMNVSMHLLAPGLTEGTVDFLTTAALQLAVPAGVTYTSDSGVFHAPEPGAAALGAVASIVLAALGARARGGQNLKNEGPSDGERTG